MQYFIGSSGTAESFVTVEPLYYELSRDWKNMFAMKKFGNIQVITIYHRTSVQGTPYGFVNSQLTYKMNFSFMRPPNLLWSIFQTVK